MYFLRFKFCTNSKFSCNTYNFEKVLMYRFIRKRCIFSIYKLIFFYLRLVNKISYNFTNFKHFFSVIFNEGLNGLINALLYYNPEKNYKLITFIFLWVHFSILKHLKTIKKNSIDNKNLTFFRSFPVNFNTYYENFLFFFNKKNKKFKLKSSILYLLPSLQVIFFSSYIFNYVLTEKELCFLLDISIQTIKKFKRKILSILYILCN